MGLLLKTNVVGLLMLLTAGSASGQKQKTMTDLKIKERGDL